MWNLKERLKKFASSLWIFAFALALCLPVYWGIQTYTGWKANISMIQDAWAYTFSSQSGLTISDTDVSNVSDQAWVAITSYMQIFKFLWIGLLVWVVWLIVNKVFSLVKIG